MKTINLFAFLLLTHVGVSQSIFNNESGKAYSKISHSDKNVHVKVPVPSDYKNHHMILVNVSLESKTKNTAENKALFPLSNAQYYKEYRPEYLEGKKVIDAIALNADGTSDFTYISYPNVTNYFNLDRVASISARTEEEYHLVVRVFGQDIDKYEYKDDGYGNMVKEPIYKFQLKKLYKIDYNAGKPSENILTDNGTFAIPKVDQNESYLWVSYVDLSKNDDRKSYDINPKDQIKFKSKSEGDNYYYVKGLSLPTSKVSYDALKDKVIENLVRDANSHYNYRSVFNEDDLIYVEKYCATYKEQDESSSSQGGFKGKFNKFKEGFSAKPVSEEDINAKINYAKTDVQWEKVKFGGVTCEKATFQIYTKKQLKSNSTTRTYDVNPEYSGDTRTFEVFVGEHNGHTFMFCMYKFGTDKNMSPEDNAARQKFLNGVIFN